MEFGLFMGGYVHKDRWRDGPGGGALAAHERGRAREVGDQHNWKYSWWTEHHFLWEYSHISANEVIMPFVARPHRADARRLGDHQRHAAR